MQSNTTTDRHLLERGWTDMSTRLDRELPIRSKWEQAIYGLVSLALLTLSIASLSHQHDDQPSLRDPLAVLEVAPTAQVDNEMNTELVASKFEKSTKEPSAEQITNLASSEKNSNTSEQVKERSIQQIPVKAKLNQISQTKNIKATGITENQVKQSVRPVKKTIRIRGNQRSQHSVMAAQLSIPVKSINLTKETDLKTHTTHLALSEIQFLPLLQVKGFQSDQMPFDFNQEVSVPRQRKLIPELNVGYVYSFLGVSGYNLGFGLRHHLQSVNKLSLFSGLSFTHLGKVNAFSRTVDRSSDVGVFEGESESGTGAANQTIVGQITVKNINQIALKIGGEYRIAPRLSLSVGTSLISQLVSATFFEYDSNIVDHPDLVDNELKQEFDALQSDIENNYRMTLDLMGRIHVSPRLTLTPYWKIQPQQSPLRVNQVGLNLNLALTQG